MPIIKCPNCQSEITSEQNVCTHCGAILAQAAPEISEQEFIPAANPYEAGFASPPESRNKKLIRIISVAAGIVLIISGFLKMGNGLNSLLDIFGSDKSQTKTFKTFTVPEKPKDAKPLPELPGEAKYEDFIGEFPKEYYIEVSIDIPAELNLELSGNMKLTLAETNSVTYSKIIFDGVLGEVISEDGTFWVRKGGKGTFSKIDSEKKADPIKQMTDGLAQVIKGTQMQYSINRSDMEKLDITVSGYEKVAGRDCIAYKIADTSVSFTAYLDVETKLCFKIDSGGLGSYEFEVFKTSGFSFPE